MLTVKIVKQWRGHDPGTTPELTDECAAYLLSSGYAVELSQASQPVDIAPQAESPEPPEVTGPVIAEHTRRRRK